MEPMCEPLSPPESPRSNCPMQSLASFYCSASSPTSISSYSRWLSRDYVPHHCSAPIHSWRFSKEFPRQRQQQQQQQNRFISSQNKNDVVYRKIKNDFKINHQELTYGKELHYGRQYSIHEGKWHGDIFIYKLNIEWSWKKSTSTSTTASTPSSSSLSTPSGYGSSASTGQIAQSLSDVFSFENLEKCSLVEDDDVFMSTDSAYSSLNSLDQCSKWPLEIFWDDLDKLCSVAHENFVLFMGACLDRGNLSIIMSKCNGPTLYQCLHQSDTAEWKRYQSRYHSMDMDSKKSISHQIATGMAYLHGKDMVHGRLSSVNIILDYRVKICLLDHGMPQSKHDKPLDHAYLTRGQLTYMSPELINELYVEAPYTQFEPPTTKQSDVYALGTILYELFSEQFPFQGFNSHELVRRIGTGHQEDLTQINCSDNIKRIIRGCWSFKPDQRPSFSQLAHEMNTSPSDHFHQNNNNNNTNQQQQLLLQFDNIFIRKKRKDSLSSSLFRNRESIF